MGKKYSRPTNRSTVKHHNAGTVDMPEFRELLLKELRRRGWI